MRVFLINLSKKLEFERNLESLKKELISLSNKLSKTIIEVRPLVVRVNIRYKIPPVKTQTGYTNSDKEKDYG